jgi:Secretion system C-terminal sorting domain/Lamin Tail Domain
MKKNLLIVLTTIISVCFLKAQNPPAACAEIFISEYSHGKYNNRAMELYNPTANEIDLTQYQIGRNDNGGTTVWLTTFPAGAKIKPFKTYVVVCDKRDTTQYKVGLEYPIFDGFEKWDTTRKADGTPDKYTDGTFRFSVVVDTLNGNLPIRGKVYRDFLDLQCRASSFMNPVYAVNRTFYFSGNDAMMLFKGATPDITGFKNLVDMVGIYNDADVVSSSASWKDWRGFSVSDQVTLVRKREIKNGTGLVAKAKSDTFRYADWLVFTNNNAAPSFQNLGSHTCDCETAAPVSGRRTCAGALVSANAEIAPVEFTVYPNPSVSGNIVINAEEEIENIAVYNLMGQLIENKKIPFATESVQLTLDNVQKGFYLIQVKTKDNRIGVKKLVIE